MKLFTIASIISIMSFSVSANAADINAGKEIAETRCAACHGADGNSTNPEWPKLAGQNEKYIITELKKFKDGERINTLMSPMAMGLSDADMENLAAFYASQTTSEAAADETLIEGAEKIYRGGIADRGVPACAACHGPNGSGNPGAGYPKLAGQHAAYTDLRLVAYKAEGQADGAKTDNIMAMVAKNLTKAEIEALANYIQGLR